MKFYLTGKGSWNSDQKNLLYIGDSLDEAKEAVPRDTRRHEVPRAHFPTKYPYLFAAIPERLSRKMEAFYSTDGWWTSIVSIEVESTNQ